MRIIKFVLVSLILSSIGNASSSQHGARLTWDVEAGTMSRVYRSNTHNGPYTAITSRLTTNNYTDYSVKVGNTYYYVVTSTNSAGESPTSNEAVVTIH